MELQHKPGDIINQRYRILNIIGCGGVGITYEAENLQSGEQVALKALSLRGMSDWKSLELFKRESQTLAQLNHPAVPRYLDYFEVDNPEDRGFYIAQKLAPGKSLASLMEHGWQPSVTEVKKIAIALLEILVYLQEFTPAVIHRDIKPQNIILSETGQVSLVDFGAVVDTYHQTVTCGSTIVGTYGYMAPEQFWGQANLRTDLYGLGATILFLLTGESPADLTQSQLKIQLPNHLQIDKVFRQWLDIMLEPVADDRFKDAQTALAVLQSKDKDAISHYSYNYTQKIRKPNSSNISLTKTNDELIVEIPSQGFRSELNQFFTLLLLSWYSCFFLSASLLFDGNVIYYYIGTYLLVRFIDCFMNINGDICFTVIFYFICLIGLFPIGGCVMIYYEMRDYYYWFLFYNWFLLIVDIILFKKINLICLLLTAKTQLIVKNNTFYLKWFIKKYCIRQKQFNIDFLYFFSLDKGFDVFSRLKNFFMLNSKKQAYEFGTNLSEVEQEWLLQELSFFLYKK